MKYLALLICTLALAQPLAAQEGAAVTPAEGQSARKILLSRAVKAEDQVTKLEQKVADMLVCNQQQQLYTGSGCRSLPVKKTPCMCSE